LALAGDPERDAEERLKFFENGIAHSWAESATKLCAMIDKQYTALRALERK
jgi:hypothetical protein